MENEFNSVPIEVNPLQDYFKFYLNRKARQRMQKRFKNEECV
jgi:hypothetical protein